MGLVWWGWSGAEGEGVGRRQSILVTLAYVLVPTLGPGSGILVCVRTVAVCGVGGWSLGVRLATEIWLRLSGDGVCSYGNCLWFRRLEFWCTFDYRDLVAIVWGWCVFVR